MRSSLHELQTFVKISNRLNEAGPSGTWRCG
jgi:hypothetical protein